MSAKSNPFGARGSFDGGAGKVGIYRLSTLEKAGLAPGLGRLPFSIQILLESVLRNCDGYQRDRGRRAQAGRLERRRRVPAIEIPFKPARVVLQDFTGVPAVVDLAAMRTAMQRLGGDPKRINPLMPVDLVIDHSVQVDHFGSPEALAETSRSSSSATASATSSCAGARGAFQQLPRRAARGWASSTR